MNYSTGAYRHLEFAQCYKSFDLKATAFLTIFGTMTWIDFARLPSSAGGYSGLFLDFIAGAPGVRPFYPLGFKENSAFEAILREQQEHPRDRKTVAAVLREQNERFGASPRTRCRTSLPSRTRRHMPW